MIRPKIGTILYVVLTLVATHVALVAWLGANQSPNVDEPAHLAAGMTTWQYGSFELYCVNPPLMRAVATLPILFMPHEELWGDFEGAPQPRPEFVLGAQFVESHPDRWRRFLLAARWALLPFTVLGGLFCYLWADELFGQKAGLLAVALWCFSPNVLTWSSLICTDGVAAAMGIGAGYFFWRWLKQPTWQRAALAGVFLGLAQLSKMTWIILFALWPALWMLWRLFSARRTAGKPQLVKLAGILLIGLYVLNLGYLFDGSLTRLGDFDFSSRLLSGNTSQALDGSEGNRFTGTVLQGLPVPLPRHFVRGMDLQKADFEQGKPSYLFDEWSDRGWWYYYLVGLALKVPLGTWGLGLLAAACYYSCWRAKSAHASPDPPPHKRLIGARDQVVLLAPALGVLVLVSSQDGFSRHFRYVLPALPFAFVWIGQVANQIGRNRVLLSACVTACLGWSAVSSMAVYPHTMSYFNEIAGGPARGHLYMLHSSFSWSQDQFYLKKWLQVHPEVDSPYTSLYRSVSLERIGIHSRGAPPRSNQVRGEKSGRGADAQGPIPGWHVLDVQHIHNRDEGYLYFLEFEPVATVGYSISIYHIGLDDANRVRRSIGLPEISRPQIVPEDLIGKMVAARDASRSVAVALFAASEQPGATSQAGVRRSIENAQGLSLSLLSEEEIRNGDLKGYDVLVVPGGQASLQGSALGVKGRTAIREFVREGGGYVGVCAGAYLAAVNYDWSLKLVNARTMTGQRFVPGQGQVSSSFRGWGTVSVELTDYGRDLFGGSPRWFKLEHTGGPVLSRANEPTLPDYVPLADFRSEVWKHPFQKGTMVDTPAIVAAPFGMGKVILFSPHPESAVEYKHLLARAIRACAKKP